MPSHSGDYTFAYQLRQRPNNDHREYVSGSFPLSVRTGGLCQPQSVGLITGTWIGDTKNEWEKRHERAPDQTLFTDATGKKVSR